ncbi:MAG: dTDP-4-dehydrorhamnose reductase [Burkholderiaceae bacterium]|nr:dTDP-4-dehydrorhamnose reductase [Burkholderiaceae bacterium]
MNILLFGKNGQLGTELLRTLSPLGKLTALDRGDADLRDTAQLKRVLTSVAPDVIVNPAAYTRVDQAEDDRETAFRVNALAPQTMAEYARYNGSLLVYYSTDYVFDGTKDAPYVETDVPAPINVYGESKWAGEQAVFQQGCHHLIFRTSWVYSSHGNNFVKTVLRLAREKDSLRVVSDQIGTPTAAELLADVTALAIAGFFSDLIPEGTYHLTAAGETSWYGLACRIVEKALEKKMPLRIGSDDIVPVSTQEYPLPARRPLNSRLDTRNLTQKMGFPFPHWTYHLDRVIKRLASVP